MRIYDQDKNLLKEYSVLNEQVPNLLSTIACPEYTYAYQDKCVLMCPLTYYQYKNGTRGVCTLSPFPGSVPSRGSVINNGTNTSYNYDEAFKACPYLSTNYSYGCTCMDNTYYNTEKSLCTPSNLCVI